MKNSKDQIEKCGKNNRVQHVEERSGSRNNAYPNQGETTRI